MILGLGIGLDYCLHCPVPTMHATALHCFAQKKQILHYLPWTNFTAPALQVLPYFACQCQCLESQPVRQKLLFQGDRVNIMQSSCYLCWYSPPQFDTHFNCRFANAWSFCKSFMHLRNPIRIPIINVLWVHNSAWDSNFSPICILRRR